jgi:hypothetical protein
MFMVSIRGEQPSNARFNSQGAYFSDDRIGVDRAISAKRTGNQERCGIAIFWTLPAV